MNKPKCPDCEGDIELEYIDVMYLDYKDSIQKIAHPYYKCPKCRKEYELTEVDDG